MRREFEEIGDAQLGKLYRMGNGIYAFCSNCHGLVKLNKFFIGSIHLCEPDEPRRRIL